MEKKYQIELTETQMRLIADCVEDCHRFMGGQTELSNMISRLETYHELSYRLNALHALVTPLLPHNASYGWSDADRMTIADKWLAAKELPEGKYEYYFNFGTIQDIFREEVDFLAKSMGINYNLTIE